MRDYLSDKAKRLTPYVAGIQPGEGGWIKLNTNENPYPPSPSVISALKNALKNTDAAKIKLYPDGNCKALCTAIANRFNVSRDNVFCGNGSDEVIALAFQAFFSEKKNVAAPAVSYAFYPVWGDMFDVGMEMIPLREDYTINAEDYKNTNGVILANPNAPIGNALSLDEIEKVAYNNSDGVVIIDEAYIDFAEVESAVSLIGKYNNLLVVRTFSKSHSLAGMRVGYAIGDKPLIDGMFRMKNAFNSYPLDTLAQIGAIAAIEDISYWDKTRNEVIAVREKTAVSLRQAGLYVSNSQANFLFFGVDGANDLYEFLLQEKILVRHWNNPILKDFIRVTVGLTEDMEVFVECVKRFLKEKPMKQT